MFNCKNCSRKEIDFDMPVTISEEKVYKQIVEEKNYDPPNTAEIISHLNVRPDVLDTDIIEQLLPLYQQITFPTKGTDEYEKLSQDKCMGPYMSEFERQLSMCKHIFNSDQTKKITQNVMQVQRSTNDQLLNQQYIEINEDMTYKPKNRTLSNGNRSDSIALPNKQSQINLETNVRQKSQEQTQLFSQEKSITRNQELNKTTKMLLEEYKQNYGSESPIDQNKFQQFVQQKLQAQTNQMNTQTFNQHTIEQETEQYNNLQSNSVVYNFPDIADEKDPEPFEIPIVNMTSKNSIKKRIYKEQLQQMSNISETKVMHDLNKSQTQSIQKMENASSQNQNLSLSNLESSKKSISQKISQSGGTENFVKNSTLDKQFQQINDLVNKNNELINDFPNIAFSKVMDCDDLVISQLGVQNTGDKKFIFKTEGQNLKIEYIDYTYTVPLIPSNFVYNEKDMTLSVYARKYGKMQKIVINDPAQFYWQIIKREILRAFGDGGYQIV